MSFRRPARYLNDGVPDFERDLALDGTTLFGSVKSALLVDVVAQAERSRSAPRTCARTSAERCRRWVAPHDPVSAAIVTAVLIGDRTGLPDEMRERLQAAGTYHVIAISGGNIAILAALACGLLRSSAFAAVPRALVTIAVLVAYAVVVTAGPSVWRATLMAVAVSRRARLDHRTPAGRHGASRRR